MSFSSEVKDELAGVYPKARHCKIAELAGIMGICEGEGDILYLQSENDALQRKFFTLLLKAFNIDKAVSVTFHVTEIGVSDTSVNDIVD